jgi:chlorite dismutase
MVTVGMSYKVLPGKEETFEKGFVRLHEIMKGVPGHVKTRLYHESGDARSFLIASAWESEDAYHAFVRSPEFDEITLGREKVLAERPHHGIYFQ